MSTLLELQDITVSFDGFKALNSLNFSIATGEIRMVIGPNGAGKSTMCDTIIGKVRPQQGKVLFEGREIHKLSEHKIVGLGIGRKFQAPGVLEALTVKENLQIAVRRNKQWYSSLFGRSAAHESADIDQVLKQVGLLEKVDSNASQLSHGEKQWLEIAMVLVQKPKLLLLDEPTAGMTAQETAQTATLLQSLAGQHSVLVIDHDMSFVELLAAPVTVLHMGTLFKQGSLQEIRDDSSVQEIYLGRAKQEGEHAHA